MAELAPEHGEDWQGLGVAILHRLVVDTLLDSAGTVIVHSDSVEIGEHLPAADVRTDVRGGSMGVRRIGLPGGHGPTGVRVDIAVGTRIVETGPTCIS